MLGQRGGSQDERSATITSGKVEIIQKKCSTFTEEKRSGSRVIFADNTHEPGGGMLLDCSRSRVWRIQEEMSSTYTTRTHTRGVVLHMFRRPGSVHKRCSDT